MYDEINIQTIRRYLVDGVFRAKIGVSVFEDAIALLNTFPDPEEELEQLFKIIDDYEVYERFAVLELKMKFPSVPLRHKGTGQKFVDIYKDLAIARQKLKVLIAKFLASKEVDLSSPEIDTGANWVPEMPTISELPDEPSISELPDI
jgi:hypothetical protein